MNTATTLDRPIAIAAPARPFNLGPVTLAAGALAIGAMYLNAAISWRQAALFLVGGAAGVVLYHAAFGFTSAWRAFIVQRRGDG